MKKQIMAGIMAVMMVLTMMQTTAFAGSEKTMEPSTETMCGVSDDTPELSSSEEDVESGGKPGEADASFDTEDEQHAKTEESSETDSEKAKIDAAVGTKNDERVETEESSETDSATGKSDASLDIEDEEQVTTEESSETVSEVSEEALSEEDAIAPIAETNYEVSSDSELIDALNNIQASTETEATIVLKADVTVQSTSGGSYTASFGVTGKHITVKSDEGEMKKLSFLSYGVLNGDCTFDNVNVTGSRLFCNGYRTIFTENGQIHLSETLYGGGYKTTVNSTYVVIAASGYINPSSSSGLHDVIGGSYQGSVEGDTYLEITGDIQMQGGNHLNPGCMKGDGTSGDGRDVPDAYVGGNATLIYDNKNSTAASPAIEGTYGCEMKGDVTLDVRAGSVAGIVGTEEPVDKSIIRGNLHIIAGNPAYENTDQVLRLGSNWPIIGAGNSFALYPGAVGNYTVGGNITIDTYENAWAWDKGTTPTSYDLPEIYGALRGNVGGNITINAHGSHVQNIFGASDSVVQGSVTVNATDVELKNSEYDTEYDEGYIFGLWQRVDPATAVGPVTVTVNGGDVGLVMATDQETVPAGSSINVTGKPKIRSGIRGTQASSYSTEFPVANVYACEATIPFIKGMSQVNITNNSAVTAHIMTSNAGLMVEEGSTLTTDNGQVWIWGDTVINGTWEQLHSQTTNYNDIFVNGTTQIGSKGHLINHGTSNLSGAVTNNGVMALMGPAYLQNDYTATNGELRLPTIASGANYDTGTIPVQIKGLSTGTTTVNTVDPADWNILKKPALGDNYILSKKNTDAPAQEVFLLGNEDALQSGWFLKRMADADGTDDYYMWQVASGIRMVFDKNGGDTEASPRVMLQEKIVGVINHFNLPTVEPTRSGYKFTGWNTKSDGTGDVFTAETDVIESMTVYAQWQPLTSSGNLTVSKTVTGNAGDTSTEFHFTVKLDTPINGTYGDMSFTDGTALLTLKHNEKKTATGLPTDVHYEVTETEANQNGYTTTDENASGIIVKDTTVVASFTNNKNSNTSGGQPTGTTPTPGNNSSDKPTGTTSTNSNHSENITGLASSPQTGDQNNITLWIVLLVGSLLGLTGIVNVVVKKSWHREKCTK
ncbi:hypothetical protein DWZ08_12110 [Clostridiaceae bacterium AF29-16BH]|nr:hypothetical protein DWZ08_12110 [Clostridiaceae bacterium AF29-16BH]